jgi:hypothetical protein
MNCRLRNIHRIIPSISRSITLQSASAAGVMEMFPSGSYSVLVSFSAKKFLFSLFIKIQFSFPYFQPISFFAHKNRKLSAPFSFLFIAHTKGGKWPAQGNHQDGYPPPLTLWCRMEKESGLE